MDFKDRLLEEYKDLCKKLNPLHDFIVEQKAINHNSRVPDFYELLEQETYMRSYRDVLEVRMAKHGIPFKG